MKPTFNGQHHVANANWPEQADNWSLTKHAVGGKSETKKSLPTLGPRPNTAMDNPPVSHRNMIGKYRQNFRWQPRLQEYIPGYAGHVPEYSQTLGKTYGLCTREIINNYHDYSRWTRPQTVGANSSRDSFEVMQRRDQEEQHREQQRLQAQLSKQQETDQAVSQQQNAFSQAQQLAYQLTAQNKKQLKSLSKIQAVRPSTVGPVSARPAMKRFIPSAMNQSAPAKKNLLINLTPSTNPYVIAPGDQLQFNVPVQMIISPVNVQA